ncbi:ABC-type sugar transport system ATPase subunit [Natronocella acetinitrilica]|uniref:ABC-type sugar transport system ATPase subunit n=1 Tax=Natronocella acetinitrilica TaxID=414046 RepID=A0AAE3KAW8_9GAMM|nr:sn-glycerol-3-phosphate ABC transporter ATP-binding protein UgpC [Natronocella acetinitrilica]MCP1674885.1 ABC-type sugar transport system ATPase subunit [Natronocella acetinitrilica]
MGDVVLRNVEKSFGSTKVIHGVDIEIKHGEFAVFVGPSGCGKSTLLRLVAGLEEITGGDLHIGGNRVNDVPPAKRGIAMVFQSYALYPHMTVRENMGFALKLARRPEDERQRMVEQAAKILQIEPLLERKPKDLSGGQRQRVAIGRAIVRKPEVFLFDEPLSNLDASLRVQMRIELTKLHEELGATMIYVTHDQVEAMTMADKIVVLNAGRVEQIGAPLDLYHHPENLFVARFIGSPNMNLLRGEMVSGSSEQATIRLTSGEEVVVAVNAEGAAAGDDITLGVRPEHLDHAADTSTDSAALTGEVSVIEHLGESTLIYLALSAAEEPVVARFPGDARFSIGDKVSLGLKEEDCHLFNADGVAFPRTRVRLNKDSEAIKVA